MKKYILIIIINFITIVHSYSNEITNIEWNILGDIQVTVFSQNSSNKVSCTAFYLPENEKAIGGDFSFYKGSVAQIVIDVPNSYSKKPISDFKILCY